MKSTRARLDRLISQKTQIPMSEVRLMLARKQVEVDGNTALDHKQIVTQFSRISVNGQLLQDNSPVYLMLHKPRGVVCATQDKRHTTVIDLIDHPMKDHLHIAGRLDFNSTGIVLLTNDGHWSRNLFSPTAHIQNIIVLR
jgi:16S rRNA uridine-516 pseudouridylate synthase and related pseudouridylate synthases